MTIKKLERYKSIKNEIKDLERRIEKAQSVQKVFDTVTASQQSFPYVKHTVKVEGDSTHTAELKLRLRNRRAKLRLELDEIETFVDTVDDSEVRQIIQLKYIDGLTWTAVSSRVYGYPSEGRARIRLHRYFGEY